MQILLPLLHTALTLTGIVLVMMLLIEMLNVRTEGRFMQRLKNNTTGQILFGVFMGLLPGCFGTFFIVSLFTHGTIGFGALVATMIATSGDESFLMFSLFPQQAIIINVILAVVGIASGFIVHFIFRNKKFAVPGQHFTIHQHEHAKSSTAGIRVHLKNMTFQRAALIFGLALVVINLVFADGMHGHQDEHGHDHAMVHFHFEEYLAYIFAGLSFISLILMFFVSDHFISAHLWGHVIKKHFLKVFLWTFGALILIELALPEMHAEDWVRENPMTLLLLASFIGLIPESGPHMVFVTLFAGGYIPLGVLIASSIVQDGHGALPLLAESQKNFLLAKFVNLLIGLLVGYLFIIFNVGF